MEPDELDVTAAAGIPEDVATAVRRILGDRALSTALSALGGTAHVHIEALVDAGQSLASAHGTWRDEYVTHVEGLPPFAHQRGDARTPSALARVTCECVEERTGGMSSHYGFRGHFVSLLVSVAAGAIWDARAERAS